MIDVAHEQTDKQLSSLERKLKKEYRKAYKEIQESARKYFEEFEKQDKEMLAKLKENKITEKQYRDWRAIEMATGQRYKDMQSAIAKDLSNTNQIAASMIGDHMDNVYANNFNYGTYEIEHGAGVSTNFTLYNKDTVKELLTENPTLLPKPRLDIPKDLRWNKKAINSALLQGILQGDSVDKIADRLQGVTDMNRGAAIRNARTMTTRAENSGRQNAYERGNQLGINSRKMWVATLDGRTRHSHRVLDKEVVDLDEKFSNGLMFPSDPDGAPAEVYNCRCGIIAIPDGINPKEFTSGRVSNYMDNLGMTYDDWKNQKRGKKK